jgi:DnaJ-class molecular chaperone
MNSNVTKSVFVTATVSILGYLLYSYLKKQNISKNDTTSNTTNKKSERYFPEFEPFNLDDYKVNNLYEVLNISKKATKKDVELQHKALMKIFHPDKYQTEHLKKQNEVTKIAQLLNYAKSEVISRIVSVA